MHSNFTLKTLLGFFLLFVCHVSIFSQTCATQERMSNTTVSMDFETDNTTSSQSYSITNANLLGNGATITLNIRINRVAYDLAQVQSTLDISFGGTKYVTITNPAGTNPANATVTTYVGASTSSSSIALVSSTNVTYVSFTISLPGSTGTNITPILNTGILKFDFKSNYSSSPSGDFHINSLSFKSCPIGFSGSVFNDKDGLNAGGVNGSGSSTIPSSLYVNLVNNTTSTVVSSSAVSTTNGSYSISSAGTVGTQPASGYSLVLTTSAISTTPIITSGWFFVGQSTTNGGANVGTGGTGKMTATFNDNTTNSNQTAYFGIDQNPTANTVSKTGINPLLFNLTDLSGYKGILSSSSVASPLSGTDPEDGTLGTGSTFKIISVGSNTILYYGNTAATGTQLTAGSTISNYNPTLLRIYGIGTGYGASFTYAALDAASVVSSTVSYSLTSNYTLPVKLTDFKATTANGQAVLSWVGTLEENFNYYQVQKSTDGTSFTDLTKIYGKGSGNRYHDSYPIQYDKEYVRLKMVDLDGAYTLSNVLPLYNNADINFSPTVYPNPVGDVLIINKLSNELKDILVFDINGKVLYKSQTQGQQISINTANWVPGMYMIHIKTNKGEKSSLKIIKK